MVGRETGWAGFTVCTNTKKETLQAVVTEGTAKEATVFTDENRSYLWLESEGESRERKAVDHSESWAKDRDGDGIREVHVCAPGGHLDKPAEPTETFSRCAQGPIIRVRGHV